MKKLILIRHTQPNIVSGVCYGQLDIDVADSFESDAAEIKGWLQSVDLLISSPLLRSKRLAEFLSDEFDCEWREDSRLMEMCFGKWEGQAWSDIGRCELDAWSEDVLNFTPPHGESAKQMMLRVQALLQDISLLPQQQIALVAHGGSMRAILALVGKLALPDVMLWQIDFGAVIEIWLA